MLAELPHHQFAHFACHGDMDLNIAAGYLELADARLYPWDVLSAAVPETVVLNACLGVSTERIETTSDAAFGLQDAFLLAGARNVIGGLWDVNEWTAHAFADSFYRKLSCGRDVASAVITAQGDLRAATSDPFLWAPHACFSRLRTSDGPGICAPAPRSGFRPPRLTTSRPWTQGRSRTRKGRQPNCN